MSIQARSEETLQTHPSLGLASGHTCPRLLPLLDAEGYLKLLPVLSQKSRQSCHLREPSLALLTPPQMLAFSKPLISLTGCWQVPCSLPSHPAASLQFSLHSAARVTFLEGRSDPWHCPAQNLLETPHCASPLTTAYRACPSWWVCDLGGDMSACHLWVQQRPGAGSQVNTPHRNTRLMGSVGTELSTGPCT